MLHIFHAAFYIYFYIEGLGILGLYFEGLGILDAYLLSMIDSFPAERMFRFWTKIFLE